MYLSYLIFPNFAIVCSRTSPRRQRADDADARNRGAKNLHAGRRSPSLACLTERKLDRCDENGNEKMRTRCWERLTYLPMVPRWPPGHRAESLLIPLLCDNSGNTRHWSSARLRLAAGINQTLRTPIFCGLAVFWGRVTRGLLSRPEHRGHVHGRLGRPDLSDPWLQMWRKVP